MPFLVPKLVRRIALLVAAAGFFAGGFVTFALGGCHDSGGFCADEFSSTHVEAYASGAVLATIAAVLAALAFTRRVIRLVITAVATAAIVSTAAVALESWG